MNRYGPFRFANAFVFGVVGWGMALAALQTWFGIDPASLVGRIPAFGFGLVFAWHVWCATQRHIVDLPSAVFFPAKYPVALSFGVVVTWLLARLLSKTISVTLFGEGAGLPPSIEFVLWLVVAFGAQDSLEDLVFGLDLGWLLAPGVVVRATAASLSRFIPRFDHTPLLVIPSSREIGERAGRWWQDYRRRVRRRSDDSPVRTQSEARRHAERDL